MDLRIALSGVGVINVTPYTPRDRFNESEYCRHLNWLIEQGVSFVLPLAATGQALQSSEEEYRKVLAVTVEAVAGRVAVTAYAGRASTEETIRYAGLAREIGCDAVYIMQPYFTRPNADGLFRHYMAVAEAVDIPIILYNNPVRSGIDLPLDVVERLVNAAPVFVAFKQGDLSALVDTVSRLGERIIIMPRAEKELLMGLALGTAGAVTFSGNIIPGPLVELVRAWRQGDYAGARRLYERVLPLINIVHIEPIPAAIKYALGRMGWEMGGLRPPVYPLSAAGRLAVDRVLTQLELA
ncbi:MAG: dihydrodipicolinate synthase family protein [Ardenticatenaceae bacterium]|nr:dihydrodipicolinate synthase family protein [Ardenticatenaceae bacterium]